MPLIEKNTNQDKCSILSNAVRSLKTAESECCHSYSPWMLDFDENYVYFELYSGTEYNTYRVSYTYNGTSATLGNDRVRVVRTTEYKEVVSVEKSAEDSKLFSMFKAFIEKFSSPEDKDILIIKAFNEEEMVAIEPLYIAAGEVDLHGDTMESEAVYAMVEEFNKSLLDGTLCANFFHKMDADKFKIEKAWVNEVECIIGEQVVPPGQPIARVKFFCEKAWNNRKNGKLGGLSIGAHAEWEEIADE